MTKGEINRKLREMTIGRTRTINGRVVTRWSENRYEVDTWGKKNIYRSTASRLIAMSDSDQQSCETERGDETMTIEQLIAEEMAREEWEH